MKTSLSEPELIRQGKVGYSGIENTQPWLPKGSKMKSLRIIVPALVTALVTAFAIFSVIWLTALVPDGEWSELIKAGIVVFIVGALLLVITWSAYFTYIVRQTLKQD